MKTSKGRLHALLCAAVISGAAVSTGCQMEIGGQTLPSPYYHFDDVQYYAPGAEFLLPNEAAALQSRTVEDIGPGLGRRDDLPPGEFR